MDAPGLPDAIHPPDTLFEPHWIPRQLEVDDQTTGALKIDALCCGVCGDQQLARCACKLAEHLLALGLGQAAVKKQATTEHRLQVRSRVAVFGKDQRRFVCSPQKPREHSQLRLEFVCGGAGSREQGIQERSFTLAVGQRQIRRPGRRAVFHAQVATAVIERQRQLMGVAFSTAQSRQPAFDGGGERPGARECTFAQHRCGQRRGAVFVAKSLEVPLERRKHPLFVNGRAHGDDANPPGIRCPDDFATSPENQQPVVAAADVSDAT